MNRQSSVGLLAASLAGHDKNKIYLIVKEEEDWFWLADGKDRRLENPKKKNKKHVRLIKYYTDRELTEDIHRSKDFSDLKIKRVIKAYESLGKEDK